MTEKAAAAGSGNSPKRPRKATPGRLGAPRDGKGLYLRTVETAERDGQAAKLRAHGASLREIASALGWQTEEGARQAVMRALRAAAVDEGGAELLALERMRLDDVIRRASEVVAAPGYVTSPRGELVCGPDGQPLPDQAARLAALNTIIRASESVRRLLGLDARDGLREREIRLREAEAGLMVRVLELAGRQLGLDVDQAAVSAVIEGAIVEATAEAATRALPPGQA